MTLYGERNGAGRPVLQIAMPRSPRIYAPGGTIHVVGGQGSPSQGSGLQTCNQYTEQVPSPISKEHRA
jgi:hypothetical protein